MEDQGDLQIAEIMRMPYFAAHQWGIPDTKWVDLGGGISIEFSLIPPGVAMLGDRCDRRFTIERPFYMSRYPITQEQYHRAMGPTPSNRELNKPKHPVTKVTWAEARNFATNIGCRLPCEVEWEYACRATTNSTYALGDVWSDEWGNVNTKGTTKVGSYAPNYWGLYDMHGNVWEWCQDEWSDQMTYPLEGEKSDPLFISAPSAGDATKTNPNRSTAHQNESNTTPGPAWQETGSVSLSEGEKGNPFVAFAAVRGSVTPGTAVPPSAPGTLPVTPTTTGVSASHSEDEQGDPFTGMSSYAAAHGTTSPGPAVRPTDTGARSTTSSPTSGSVSSTEGEHRRPFTASFEAGHGYTVEETVVPTIENPPIRSVGLPLLDFALSSEGEHRRPFTSARFAGVPGSAETGSEGHGSTTPGSTTPGSLVRPTEEEARPKVASATLASASALEGEQSDTFRAFRGGSCYRDPLDCRAAVRDRNVPSYRYHFVGLPLVRNF
jgi:formylglycine-generating enzyme required for sulfatase activity